MFQIEVLNRMLPVWTSTDSIVNNSARIDNNYFSASYREAINLIETLKNRGFRCVLLSELRKDLFSGVRGYPEGDIPVMEGINILPNCILTDFEKFIDEAETKQLVGEKDILITKHGSPCALGYVSSTFLKNTPQAVVGTEVFVLRLKEEYQFLSAYISCWLNSTYGQALLRRWVAGSVSPTLRRLELEETVIPIPEHGTLGQVCEEYLEDLQSNLLKGMDFIRPSEDIMKMLGHEVSLPRLLTNWYSGVGRDPHGFHRQGVHCIDLGENIIEPELPIWVNERPPSDRIDNNYFYPGYEIAMDWIKSLNLPIRTIGEMKETIFVGETPQEEGEIPVIEGRNIKPNCLLLPFYKYTDSNECALEEYDLVVVRSGTSGVTALILPQLKSHFEALAVSDHVHVVRLKNEFRPCAAYICAFLNSKAGQSLIRRYIAGSISPTLNRRDLVNTPIPIPQDERILLRSKELLTNLQDSLLKSSLFVEPSDKLIGAIGLWEPLPKLPVNWMPGGTRDPQGYYKRQM